VSEYEDARQLADRMADKAAHPALLLRAAGILQSRGYSGDRLLAATLRCAADALPWTYGVGTIDVDDVMTGLVRTADEIVQNDEATDPPPAVDTLRVHRKPGQPTRLLVATGLGAILEVDVPEGTEVRLSGWLVDSA